MVLGLATPPRALWWTFWSLHKTINVRDNKRPLSRIWPCSYFLTWLDLEIHNPQINIFNGVLSLLNSLISGKKKSKNKIISQIFSKLGNCKQFFFKRQVYFFLYSDSVDKDFKTPNEGKMENRLVVEALTEALETPRSIFVLQSQHIWRYKLKTWLRFMIWRYNIVKVKNPHHNAHTHQGIIRES
jgi:hypothetical protein